MDFEKLFRESRGEPVEYSGQIIMMKDDFPLEGSSRISVTLESTSSKWKQGISLCADGTFLVNDQRIRNQIVLWEDTMPRRVDIVVECKQDSIQVKNVWDTGNGVMHSWYYGAAMTRAEIPLGRRYRCNDGAPDADFDDIVFRIERR